MPYKRATAQLSNDASPLQRAAERLTTRVGRMERELHELRTENASLRADIRNAITLFNRFTTTRGAEPVAAEHPSRVATHNARSVKKSAPSNRRRRRKRKTATGRVSPRSVTADVVRAVIAKLGPSTAGEIAQEITKAGAPVSGRAIRFIAEHAGAQVVMGSDGRRRYR